MAGLALTIVGSAYTAYWHRPIAEINAVFDSPEPLAELQNWDDLKNTYPHLAKSYTEKGFDPFARNPPVNHWKVGLEIPIAYVQNSIRHRRYGIIITILGAIMTGASILLSKNKKTTEHAPAAGRGEAPRP